MPRNKLGKYSEGIDLLNPLGIGSLPKYAWLVSNIPLIL